jgi:hypothetical protein
MRLVCRLGLRRGSDESATMTMLKEKKLTAVTQYEDKILLFRCRARAYGLVIFYIYLGRL